MSEGNNHKIFTAEDIRRYHQGQMTLAERHALERAALDDPFLADAIEGYVHAGDAAAELAALRTLLAKRVGERPVIPLVQKPDRFKWVRVAAAIVVLLGGALLASQFLFNQKQDGLADSSKKEEKELVTQDTTGSEGVEITFGQDSSSTFPIVVEEEPSSGGQPSVTSTRPVTAEPTRPSPVKASEERDVAAPVSGVVAGNETKPVTSAAEEAELSDAPRKLNEVADRKMSAEQEKAAITKSRSIGKNRADNAANIIRGRVTDENNRGLPFANVTSTRDNQAVYADATGQFTITSNDSIVEVQVRSLGYDDNVQQLRSSVPDNQVVLEQNKEEFTRTLNTRSNSNALRRNVYHTETNEDEPQPADGWANYDLYLNNNINIPKEASLPSATPREVELSFEVNRSGEPVNIRVERSLCKPCDKEAIRLVKEGPKWERNARQRTRITVAF